MIQSVTFGNQIEVNNEIGYRLIGKNTYADWKLLAVTRPIISPPEPKTNFVDIPGGNGSLDLSESLTGYPLYSNRTGSFKFRVLNVGVPWSERYSEIMENLHGKAMMIVLEDDPEWFYKGRVSIDSWESGNTWSEITINVQVEPFKWFVQSSMDSWIWDIFNFETGVTTDFFLEIVINSPSSWVQKTFEAWSLGSAPISPVFIVSGASNLQARFVNEVLGINKTVSLINGRNEVPDFIFHGLKQYTIEFMGVGQVSLEFRKGRL